MGVWIQSPHPHSSIGVIAVQVCVIGVEFFSPKLMPYYLATGQGVSTNVPAFAGIPTLGNVPIG
jgi:hypothetical protein